MLFIYGVLALITIIGAGVQIWRSRDRTAASVLDSILSFFIFSFVGLAGVFFFYEHVFNADAAAENIGWATGNPFQFEVAMSNLGYGVAGLLCLRWRGGFRWATTTVFSVVYWGASFGHIYQLVVNDNRNPGNAGAVLYTDIALPLVLIALMTAYELSARRMRRSQLAPVAAEEAERKRAA